MIMLKQSTAVTLKFGPFVDETDGKTAETGLSITQPDVRLSKNGANMIQKSAAGTAAHDELGFYDVALSTTDTGTLGRLLVAVHESGALPVFQYFMVVPANVYNSLVAGSDDLDVALSTQGKADVNAEAGTALTDYDPPTAAELVDEINDVQADIDGLNDPTATAIADAIFRMTTATIEGAGVPDDRTLYGVIAALMHLHKRDASNITLYQSDDATVLVTIPITTDAALDPIAQINPP